jgi:hypothetical protein
MVDIFVGKIDMGFDFGKEVGNLVTEKGYGRRKTSVHLLKRHLTGSIGAGPDNINDRFGPSQIDTAIEEGPEGKFSRARQAKTGFEKEIEDTAHHQWAAMTMNLDNILTGVGSRGPHYDGHDLVDQHSFTIEKTAVIQMMGDQR